MPHCAGLSEQPDDAVTVRLHEERVAPVRLEDGELWLVSYGGADQNSHDPANGFLVQPQVLVHPNFFLLLLHFSAPFGLWRHSASVCSGRVSEVLLPAAS